MKSGEALAAPAAPLLTALLTYIYAWILAQDTSKHEAHLSWLYVGYTDMHVSSPFANCIET